MAKVHKSNTFDSTDKKCQLLQSFILRVYSGPLTLNFFILYTFYCKGFLATEMFLRAWCVYDVKEVFSLRRPHSAL